MENMTYTETLRKLYGMYKIRKFSNATFKTVEGIGGTNHIIEYMTSI